MGFAIAFAALVWVAAAPARQPPCEPLPEVRRAIDEAASPFVAEEDLERALASLRALREKLPADLFVHLRYQDAVFDRGTEGHLKGMLREYQNLAADHPGEILYEYLAGRAHLGRGTSKAVAAMERILARDPRFAPALRTLAEIHGSAMFGDAARERREREAFAALCPSSAIARRPAPLPERSALFDAASATPEQIGLALRADHARLLRIRMFDWYADETRTQELRAVQADSWKAWRLLVEHHRRAGDTARADALLVEMEERLARLRQRRDPAYPLASEIVARLKTRSASAEPDHLR
ncbi:MAG: hypothetical protein E6J61_06355 [Deltaproteobacteria bacterium]|nr:MAG: hypothetical protein E6J61_06355 [Deltaproteobacteria bacterium]